MATIGDCLRAYKISAVAEGRSPKTIRSIVQSVTYFAQYLGGLDAEVATINAESLRSFINALRQKKRWSNHPFNRSDKPLSPFTVASYVRSIKVLFSWLKREGYIEQNPLEKALSLLGKDASIAVIPQGPLILPMIEN